MMGLTEVGWEQWNGKPSRQELRITYMKKLGIYWLKMTEEKKRTKTMNWQQIHGTLSPLWGYERTIAILKNGNKER